MVSSAHRLANGIDALFERLGLDFHGYSQRHPQQAERTGVWLLAVGQTIGFAGLYYIFAALLLTWDQSFTWGKESLTFAFMVSIISAVISPLTGRVVDRGLSRWLLSGGMVLGGLALLLLGFAEHYWLFLLCWVLLGIAQGACLYEPCFAFLTRTTGAEATRNITKVTLLAGFASTLAFPSGAFLAEALGWSGASWVFAGAVLLIGVPALYAGATMIECCPHDSHSVEAKNRDRAAVRAALRKPEFWLIFLAFPLIGLTEGLILIHIVPILTSSGLSLSEAVLVSALFGPMQVAGRLAMMRLDNRLRPVPLTILSFSGILVAVLLLMSVEDVPMAAYGFSLLFGAAMD
ncbi:MAG: MFS transporter [Rhodospirillaceae bacterium]